jgi:hypothetical protein
MKHKLLIAAIFATFALTVFGQTKKPPPGVPGAPGVQNYPQSPATPSPFNNSPAPRATTPPAKCNTAAGYPCTKSTWSVASCTQTPTYGGPNGSQDSGPCYAGVLRCTGSTNVCTTASLPVQTGSPPQVLMGNTMWTALIGNFPQTTTSSDAFYDNSGLNYQTVYTYVITVEYTGSGGGVWSAYSAPFQDAFGPAPQAPAGTPATPTGLSVVQQ